LRFLTLACTCILQTRRWISCWFLKTKGKKETVPCN
jgi:hypothetical protein